MKFFLMALMATAPEEPAILKPLSLEDCLRHAQRNTGWLKQALTYKRKEWDARSSIAAFLPTLNAGYERSGEKDSSSISVSQSTSFGTTVTLSGSHSFDPSELTSDPADTSLSLSVSQPLLRGAGYSENLYAFREARYRLKIAEYDLEAKAQDTIYQVKRQYYSAAGLIETVRVREKAVERARFLYDEAAAKLERGMVTILDLANAEIQLADRETSLVSARMDLEGALDDLKLLLNVHPEKRIAIVPIKLDLEVVETEEEKKEIVVDEAAGRVWSAKTPLKGEERPTEKKLIFEPAKRSYEPVLEGALKRRPDLLANEREKKIDELDLQRKRNLFRHHLDLAGTLAFAGSANTPSGSFDLSDESWSVGLNYSYPLGRLSDRSALEKAKLDKLDRELTIRDLRFSIARSVRGIFRTLQETEKNILTYGRKISAASKALESAKIRKERGKASYWEVTARESDLLNAQVAFINSYLTYRQTLALLDRENGKPSGWIAEKKLPEKKAGKEKKKEKGK